MLTTNQKGAIAETAIAHEAVKLGIGVYRPLMDERADLVLDLRPRLIRVQCKWAAVYRGVVVVRFYTCRRTRTGMRKTVYSADEIDALAAYCGDTGSCYFFPIEEFAGRTGVQLRLDPTRNNQESGVRWASEYEFGATLGRVPGAIAQLGERLPGRQEVAGSSPAGSIPLHRTDQGRR